MTHHAGCFGGSAAVKSLRRKLGDDADNPTHILTEPRVGYRMVKVRPPTTLTLRPA